MSRTVSAFLTSRRTPLEEWAVAEAVRLVESKYSIDMGVAAQAAARRAPGLLAAALALRQLTLIEGDAFLAKAIPPHVREAVAGVEGSTDNNTVDRVHKWLRSAPYELSKCACAIAAIAAAAPVALVQTQSKDAPRDTKLEEACLDALKTLNVRHRRTRKAEAALPRSFTAGRRKRSRDLHHNNALPPRRRVNRYL